MPSTTSWLKGEEDSRFYAQFVIFFEYGATHRRVKWHYAHGWSSSISGVSDSGMPDEDRLAVSTLNDPSYFETCIEAFDATCLHPKYWWAESLDSDGSCSW